MNINNTDIVNFLLVFGIQPTIDILITAAQKSAWSTVFACLEFKKPSKTDIDTIDEYFGPHFVKEFDRIFSTMLGTFYAGDKSKNQAIEQIKTQITTLNLAPIGFPCIQVIQSTVALEINTLMKNHNNKFFKLFHHPTLALQLEGVEINFRKYVASQGVKLDFLVELSALNVKNSSPNLNCSNA